MRCESSGVVGFNLRPLLEGEMRRAKSAYNSLTIGPRGFGALSLWWIQFASVLRCARSSYKSSWHGVIQKLLQSLPLERFSVSVWLLKHLNVAHSSIWD